MSKPTATCSRNTSGIRNPSTPTHTANLAAIRRSVCCTVDTSPSTTSLTSVGNQINWKTWTPVSFAQVTDIPEYPDSRRDYWQRTVVPAPKQLSLKAWQHDTGKSGAILIDARRGRRRPHARHRALLIRYARQRGVFVIPPRCPGPVDQCAPLHVKRDIGNADSSMEMTQNLRAGQLKRKAKKP